jgi:short subunit dehydrogenase-like uncharacterized protein
MTRAENRSDSWPWMIYGANGYTGGRVARAAKARGLRPTLAGRNAGAIQALAEELRLPWKAFDLGDAAASAQALQGHAVVAHCAGPYSATSAPMLAACLATRTHYVDITGEIDVMLASHARDADARAAGIAICPGAGFDIIPTDCVAATLAQALPDATHLTLGFTGLDDLSPGTLKTALESIGRSTSWVREDAKLVPVPWFSRARRLDFGDGRGEVPAFNLPWADVATAWFSTGIANIEAYVPASSALARNMRRLRPIMPLLRFRPLVVLAQRAVDTLVEGPPQRAYEDDVAHLFGEARNARGEVRRARLRTPNGYRLTVDGVLMTVGHLRDHPGVRGFCTPSKLMGANCVERLPGTSAIAVS